ncbi:Uncharacterised protein [uncultured archaeon]|nr:Uncharacterised protein [uncultured archaeon]
MTESIVPVVPEIYINNVRINVNLYEVILLMGVSTPESDGTFSQKDLVRVRMSPQEALAVSIMLNKQLELYQDTFKKIFLPDEVIKSLKGEKVVETAGEQ